MTGGRGHGRTERFSAWPSTRTAETRDPYSRDRRRRDSSPAQPCRRPPDNYGSSPDVATVVRPWRPASKGSRPAPLQPRRNGSSPAPAQPRRNDGSPAQPVRPSPPLQHGEWWDDQGQAAKPLSADAEAIIKEAFRRIKTLTGESVLYAVPEKLHKNPEFGELLGTSKSRLYNLFGQMDLKSYVEAKAGEWRDLEDIVVGAGEGCYCEEHSVIMIGCGDKAFRERCLAVCIAAAESQKNGWGPEQFKNEAFKLIVGIAFQDPDENQDQDRVPLLRKRRAIKAEAESPATPAAEGKMSGAYEEEEGDIAEAAAIEDWNFPPNVFEGEEDGEEAPGQETRDPVRDDDAFYEIQELKQKNVVLLGDLEEKEKTIEEQLKQKAEQQAAYSVLKEQLEEAIEGQKLAQSAYAEKEQEAEATKRELESAKQEAESAKKEAENTAKEADAKCTKMEEAAKEQAEAAQKRTEDLQSSFQAKQKDIELEVADLKKNLAELQDRHTNQKATIAKKSEELKELKVACSRLQEANKKMAAERGTHEDELNLKDQKYLAQQATYLAQKEQMGKEHREEKERMANDHQEEVSRFSADLNAAREAVQNLEASRKRDQEMLERLNDEIEEERSKRSVSIPDARAAMERFLAQFGHSCNEYFDTCEAASSLAEGSTQPLPTAAHAQFQVQETLANGHEEDDAPWKRRRTRQPPGAAILPTEEKKQLPRPRQQRLLISKAKAKRRLPQPSVKFVSEPRTVDDDEVRPDISDAGEQTEPPSPS